MNQHDAKPSPASSGAGSLKLLDQLKIPDHDLLAHIGHGAYGEVWLARSVTGSYRAVKVVSRPSFDNDRPYEREFAGIQKFEPISRKHESQVDILHVGRAEGCFYYVMELADDQATGQVIDPASYAPKTLKSELFHRGHLPFEECVNLSLALTTALEHLHSHGLVHRDIKPSNIIFVNGVPKLADIGLVTGVDATRSFVGTEGFAPPEGPGTVQADLYSLGKVLYEMSTGKDRQDFPELPTRLAELPDSEGLVELNAVIAKACRADPQARYQSAKAMHDELLLLQSGKSLARVRTLERALAKLKRVSMAGGTVAVLAAAALLWQSHQARQLKRLAVENRQRVAQIQTANGLHAMDEGALATAALWFSEALKSSQGDPAAEERNRLRLGTLFRYLPQPVWVQSLGLQRETGRQSAWFFSDGQGLAAYTHTEGEGLLQGVIKVWTASNQSPIRTLHLTNIWGAFYSPSGRWAIVSEPEQKRLWDVTAARPVDSRLEFQGTGGKSEFSPDESKVATFAYQGREVRILEVPSGRNLVPPLFHTGALVCLEFDAAGRRLVTGTLRDIHRVGGATTAGARVWDASTGQPLTDVLDPLRSITHAHFSPDGTGLMLLQSLQPSVVSSTLEHVVKVFNLPSGQQRFPPLTHQDSILDAKFSPDGRFLATAGADRTAIIWNAFNGEPAHPPFKHTGVVEQLAFSPDGLKLATVCDRQVLLWQVESGGPAGPPLNHSGHVSSVSFSPDGSQLLTSSDDGLLRIWNLAKAEPPLQPFRHADPCQVTSVRFSPDGRRILTGDCVGWLQVWSADTGDPETPFMESDSGQLNINGVINNVAEFSPDGRKVAAAATDSTVRLWDATSGRQLVSLATSNRVLWVAFSPDGTRLATASSDKTARVWDTITGLPVTPPLVHGEDVPHVAFSADGGRIVTSSGDHSARVWDAASGIPLSPPLRHSDSVVRAVFSPDGSRVATASRDSTARVWDATTGQQVIKPLRHARGVLALSFSPDGNEIVTGSADSTARVWDARTGDPVSPPLAHAGYVVVARFSPEGKHVLTASYDGTARVWDAATGEPLIPPFKHRDKILDAAFSPDGWRVITGSWDTSAQVWDLRGIDWPLDDIRALAELAAAAGINSSQRLTPLGADHIQAAAHKVLQRKPTASLPEKEEAVRWHRRMLGKSEQSENWFAARFHAERLLHIIPDNAKAREDQARILRAYPLRDPSSSPKLIDLSGYYNGSLSSADYFTKDKDLGELPQGVQTLAGVAFDVRGFIILGGKSLLGPGGQPPPVRVSGVRIDQKLTRLHFLQASMGGHPSDGTRIGHYLVHFSEGRTEEIPIIYGRDLRDFCQSPDKPAAWWPLPIESNEASDALNAWRGSNPLSRKLGAKGVQLFMRTWTNDLPSIPVVSMDFVYEDNDAEHPYPFLVALTAE